MEFLAGTRKLLKSLALFAVLLNAAAKAGDLTLDNARFRAVFDGATGALVQIADHSTGETTLLRSTEFQAQTTLGEISSTSARLISFVKKSGQVEARYDTGPLAVNVLYVLPRDGAFLRKQVNFKTKSGGAFGVQHVELLNLSFVQEVSVAGRIHKSLQCQYFFGATPKGGLVAGLECPYSTLQTNRTGIKGFYTPGLKVPAGTTFECEPAFIGTYGMAVERAVSREEAEREAVTAIVDTELRRPPRRFWSAFNGWGSATWRGDLDQPGWLQSREHDYESVRCAKEAGLDFWASAATWIGDYNRLGAISNAAASFPESPERRALVRHIQNHGMKPFHWFSMNNANAWRPEGKRLRIDRNDWALFPAPGKPNEKANCNGNAEFIDWLMQMAIADIRRTKAGAFCTDGDFFGGGGKIAPVTCYATNHNHLGTNATFACWKGQMEVFKRLRQTFPELVLFACRPPQDLGAWSWRYLDCIFTTDEYPRLQNTVGCLSVGISLGDDLRSRARKRRHMDFCPYWLDSAQLFQRTDTKFHVPSHLVWDRAGSEYALLSALAVCDSAPIVYLPPRDRLIPEDLAVLRKWIDWVKSFSKGLGRLYELNLPVVDGYVRAAGDEVHLFLFNNLASSRPISFALDVTIGISGKAGWILSELHPFPGLVIAGPHKGVFQYGDIATVVVPPQSAMVLRLGRDEGQPLLLGGAGRISVKGRQVHVEKLAGYAGETAQIQIRVPRLDQVQKLFIGTEEVKFIQTGGLLTAQIVFGGHVFSPELNDWSRNGERFHLPNVEAVNEGLIETSFFIPPEGKKLLAMQPCAEKSLEDARAYPWGNPARLLLSIPLRDFNPNTTQVEVELNGRLLTVQTVPKELAPGLFLDLTDTVRFGGKNVLQFKVSKLPAGGLLPPLLLNLPRMTNSVASKVEAHL